MRCWIALHTSISTEAAQPPEHEAVQQAVASMALGFTPRVALVDEAVLMDVTGSLRLFGGLDRLVQLLQDRAGDFFASHQCRAVIRRAHGGTSLIALGRLRFDLQTQTQTQAQGRTAGAKKRVADLPMETLSAARPHFGVLERIGCRTWDDLLRLPRDGVARRFGAELLQALDRARGSVPDDYPWLVLPEHFEEKIELEALVTHAPALMEGVSRLLMNLQAWLLGRQSGLSALRLTWHLDKRRDVPPTGELEIRTAQPAQDLRHVARLVSEHLAQQQLPAPVHSLGLKSLVTERLGDAAGATGSLLMEARKQGDGVIELVERLSARLGNGNVQAWQPQANHRPEQMQRWVNARDALKPMAALKTVSIEKAATRKKKAGQTEAGAQRAEPLYPTWLLPEPIRLATLGNSPVYQGRLQRLTGPQRMEASGWLMAGEGPYDSAEKRLNPPAMRDYFIYRSEQGGLLWVYSERLRPARADAPPARHWYLHGFFA